MFIKRIFFLISILCCFQGLVSANTVKPIKGVCAFDIDSTLLCEGAKAAVDACLEAGFALAIDTARGKKSALAALDEVLPVRGFPKEFIDIAKAQEDLQGPFQYRQSWDIKQPLEQQLQQKSYALRQIARYYNLRLDEVESKKIILFDDLPSNIDQVRPTSLDPKGACVKDAKGNCYDDPCTAPQRVSFPRNWKIYRGKWIGFVCASWSDGEKAAKDAREMIAKVIDKD